MAPSTQSNERHLFARALDASADNPMRPLNGTNGLSLTAYALNPVAGTRTLIVDFAEPVVGDEISQPFTGNIKLDNVSASAAGLPTSPSTKLAAGTPVTVPVTICIAAFWSHAPANQFATSAAGSEPPVTNPK